MRPTNVAQMRLPHGRLSSYTVQVGPARAETPGAALPVSFDQARHVGRGDRPGSWMAVAFTPTTDLSRDDLAAAWLRVVRRHGTLHTVFAQGPSPSMREVEVLPGSWTQHPVAPEQDVRDVLRGVLDSMCRPFSEPSHGLCVVEPDDGRPVVVIGADHAHVDMWSFLVMVRDLLAETDPGERPLPFAVHTEQLAARPPAPEAVHRRWDQILAASGGVMPRFPLPLGDLARAHPEVVEVHDVLDPAQADRLSRRAHETGVRMLAIVLSVMADVTRRLSGESLRAVFPVHSRHDDSWHDSVGWFITNAVIECDSSDPVEVTRSIKEAMGLGTWPQAEIFAAHGGMPEAPGMFAISWLDLNRLPVAIDLALDAQLVSAVIETDGVMVWFIRDSGGLRLRCRYPDTPEARSSVGQWLAELREGLREQA